MHISHKAGLALTAAGLAIALAGGASAADLHGRGGSVKDGPYVSAPVGAVGNCYFRGDLGYSWSRDPDLKWPVVNGVFGGDANGNTVVDANELTYSFVGDTVSNTSLENSVFGAVGFGCGSGSRGLRGEVMVGIHGDRKIDGEPLLFDPGPAVGSPVPGASVPVEDPLHTSLKTYTLMFNAYHDLGKWGNVTPYVGAGVGIAYNIISDVSFTGNPALRNTINGDRDISLAWSLMAGIGYQVSHNAIIDVGYRYIDFGKATSERNDSAGFVNPRVKFDDLSAHEIKIGLRYHFGSDCCSAPAHAPLK